MVKTKPQTQTLTNPVIQSVGFTSFLGLMPAMDRLMQDTGERLDIYRAMMMDPRIGSLMLLRRNKVLNLPWGLTQAEGVANEIYALASKAVTPKLISKLAWRLMGAHQFGYAVVEVIWEEQSGEFIPSVVRGYKPELFGFQADGTLVYTGLGESKVLDDPYKFLIHRHEGSSEDTPYGQSILQSVYWPWKFKTAGFDFWIRATEKFGVPSIMALFDASSDDQARERASELAGMLASLESSSAAALGNVKDVKTLSMAGGLSDFRTLIDVCNTEISYGLTGQSLATGESQFGTRAQGEVHDQVMDDIILNDARALSYTIQKLVDWIVELNHGPDTMVPVFQYEVGQHASWAMVSQAIDRGVPVSKRALYDRYHLPEPTDEEDGFQKPGIEQSGFETPGTGNGQGSVVTDVQATALNGTQVSSLINLATQVALGALPKETALAIATASFPLASQTVLEQIFGPLMGFEPKNIDGLSLADSVKKKPSPLITMLPRN